ncbi:MAG TPA: MDR family oxidoreductase [Verrucomicrobiae bacterium]|nr:MDR family oxidoreductase [Verrucomicrobiae bacterium]
MSYPNPFRAVILENDDGNVRASIKQLPVSSLPEADVLVSVAYSSLNYKDALAVTNRGKIVRRFPMVPGIDLSGTVAESRSSQFKPGDPVVLTGWGIGEDHWGGLSQLARVKSEWLLPLPDGLTLKRAMSIGTAGLTAMFCVMALEEHSVEPDSGDILVTGATGGVGSLAVMLLAAFGYSVIAATGKSDAHELLTSLGAQGVLDRNALSARSDKLLELRRWAGVIDNVGGDVLGTVLRQTDQGGCVVAVGLAGGAELHTTVYPFILRGISLVGISSGSMPTERRQKAWKRLARLLPMEKLDQITKVARLDEIPALSEQMIAGKTRGRIVIDVNG